MRHRGSLPRDDSSRRGPCQQQEEGGSRSPSASDHAKACRRAVLGAWQGRARLHLLRRGADGAHKLRLPPFWQQQVCRFCSALREQADQKELYV